ncbi:STAS domain-containing protein [Gammaproteobacteria bacterium AS21]
MTSLSQGSLASPDNSSNMTTYVTSDCLVFPVQAELSKQAALNVQAFILDQVHSKSYNGVIIDLSGVEVIDSVLWQVFANTCVMINMLGYRTVITGLNPGVVAAIMDINVDLTKVITAMDIQDALNILTTKD